MYEATLHYPDSEYDGIVGIGRTARLAAEHVAITLSEFTGTWYRVDFDCCHVYREFMPNVGHSITVVERT